MKERPILFSSPMVRAILEGRKTQTRRICKRQPNPDYLGKNHRLRQNYPSQDEATWWSTDTPIPVLMEAVSCPYGAPGDRLWVRETWGPSDGGFCYRASERPTVKPDDGRWHPAIHMFRCASRITLEIEAVRVERLIEISEEDAEAEGCNGDCPVGHIPSHQKSPCVYHYAQLWESINGPGSWDANPWVWVIQFRRMQ